MTLKFILSKSKIEIHTVAVTTNHANLCCSLTWRASWRKKKFWINIKVIHPANIPRTNSCLHSKRGMETKFRNEQHKFNPTCDIYSILKRNSRKIPLKYTCLNKAAALLIKKCWNKTSLYSLNTTYHYHYYFHHFALSRAFEGFETILFSYFSFTPCAAEKVRTSTWPCDSTHQ